MRPPPASAAAHSQLLADPFPSLSVAAMSGTFWLWLLSLRGGKWIVFCIPCALMYFFMISAWG